jgi:hypothetical protein
MSVIAVLKRKLHNARPFANPRGALFFAQRRVRGLETRRRLGGLLASVLPQGAGEHPEAAPVIDHLERDGFAMLDGLMTPEMTAEMREYFLRQPLYAPYLPNSPRVLIDQAHTLDSHVFFHDDEAVIACPHALDIANNPRILAVMEAVLGCKPTIGYMAAWWSMPTADGVPRQAENFHRDVDDLRFIKLFVYLTDVDSDSGPHEFIRGSHVDPKLMVIRRYTDDEVVTAFGAERQVTFTGPAGSAFIENTFGMHRGLPVRKGRRLIFQVVYSLLPLVYGPARPYPGSRAPRASTRLDPYINRQYLRRDAHPAV